MKELILGYISHLSGFIASWDFVPVVIMSFVVLWAVHFLHAVVGGKIGD